MPSVLPKFGEAPGALGDPDHRSAGEPPEQSRQWKNSAKTSLLNTGQLALAYVRYVIAGEMVVAWPKYGGLGAMLTNVARLLKPSVVQDIETASRFERAQSSARAHLARGRGNLQLVRDELIKVPRGRPQQCDADQSTEFTDRGKPRGSYAGRPAYSRNTTQERLESRQRAGSSRRPTKRRTRKRGRSSYANTYKRSPKREVKEERTDVEK